jgi:hypothetical protein
MFDNIGEPAVKDAIQGLHDRIVQLEQGPFGVLADKLSAFIDRLNALLDRLTGKAAS